MPPEVPNLERMMHAKRCDYSTDAEIPTRFWMIRYSSEQKNILEALADHKVSKWHPAKENRLVRAARTVASIQATLRCAIAGILVLMEEAVAILVTAKRHNGMKKTNNRP